MKLKNTLLRSVCGLLVTAAILFELSQASACPFCLAPGQTWSEMISESQVIVLARLVSTFEGSDSQNAWTDLEIIEVHKGRKLLPHPTIVRYPDYLFGSTGELFLLGGGIHDASELKVLDTFAGRNSTDEPSSEPTLVQEGSSDERPPTDVTAPKIQKVSAEVAGESPTVSAVESSRPRAMVFSWDKEQKMTAACFRYVTAAPVPETETQERLEYFSRFLENEDSLIATDAWGEFAKCEYSDIVQFSDNLKPEDLRRWIADKNTSLEHLGIYGMMLGLCGSPKDAAFLRAQIGVPSAAEMRFGVEGLMGGLLLLEPEAALGFLEKTRLQNPNATSFDCFAVVQALQFMWEYEPTLIEKQRLRTSLYPMLEREDLREIAIRDLARWEDWTVVSKLPAVYDQCEKTDDGAISAIVGFLLVCQKKVPDTSDPRHVQARHLLEKIRTEHRRIVRMAESELR